MYITRLFEQYGVFISIVFTPNLNREPSWRYIIHTIDEQRCESGRIYDYNDCVKQALVEAIKYYEIPLLQMKTDTTKQKVHDVIMWINKQLNNNGSMTIRSILDKLEEAIK